MRSSRRRTPRILSSSRALGVLTLTLFIGLLAADFGGVLRDLFGADTHTVTAVFTDSQQLRSGDLVRMAGVDVGTVSGLRFDPATHLTTVSLAVDDDVPPLYADASAQLRWRTLLGASFAVSLSRGNPASGLLGSHAIPAARTSNQVELEDVTSIDSGAARTGLQTMIAELAKGLRNKRAPVRAIAALAAVSPAVGDGVGALRGQVPDSDLRDLVTATASTVQALDGPGELQSVVAAGATTLDTTAARHADIARTIAIAPATLANTNTTLRELNVTLGLANPLLAKLEPAAPEVDPTASGLDVTLTRANGVLSEATPLLHSLRPAVTSLASAARRGVPLLDGLTPSLDRLSQSILPYFGRIDPQTGHSAAEMVGGLFAALGPGAAGWEDGAGHFIRFPVSAGSSSTYLPCQIYAGNPDAAKLVECESLQTALSTLLSSNPVPGLSKEKR